VTEASGGAKRPGERPTTTPDAPDVGSVHAEPVPPPIPGYGLVIELGPEDRPDHLPPFHLIVPPEIRVASRPVAPQFHSLRLHDARRLEVLTAGPEWGIPLVFHHGTPFAAALPHPALDVATRRGMRLVVVSRPGYGESTAQPGRRVVDAASDTLEVLNQLGHRRFFAVGWSGGGPHALACAALAEGRCAAAASVAGVAPFGRDDLDWLAGMGPENVEEFSHVQHSGPLLDRFLHEEASAMESISASDVQDALGGLLSAADRGALSDELAESLAAGMRHALGRGIEGWRDDDLAFMTDWGFDPAAMRTPVTVWQGDQDLMVPAAHGAWLARHVAGARARLMPGEGHVSLLAAMERVVDDLVRVSNEVPY